MPRARVSRRILASGLPRPASLESCSQNRHRLPQPARRHARLMHAGVVARDGRRQVPFQRKGAALE